MNRRNRTRFKTDLTVNVSCPDLPGGRCKARLSDLSVHGLSLILKEKLPAAALVKVNWGSVAFKGELVYCKPHGGEFIVGLKVEDPVYETARKYASQ
ncbi:MAG: PilZ domain [Acidobacteria bacterium]|nr:PilZ domain [Acidobacteriota bacterium]